MEADNKDIPENYQEIPNLENNSNPASSINSKQEQQSGALKCELELIPVIAGECRAEPTSITTIERSLIRSSSAEVSNNELLVYIILIIKPLILSLYFSSLGCHG